ncbi:MAG: lysine-2,3-aminomutase-like protein [Hyphomicrobiaceae bacterium]|nr:MAG: lysine-2,3-aminomutase-like protein [Hyphomicrobiaceae bacterium]
MVSRTLRSASDLVQAGLQADGERGTAEEVASRYAIAITPAMAELIQREGPDGAIGRQFIPSASELVAGPGERPDPIGDEAHTPLPGVVHRYPDRVLLKLVHTCPVYCRFCFRREMVGPGKVHALDGEALAAALAYVRERPEIFEVILTGGDPFVLSPRRIANVTTAIAAIPHVAVLRWHTRVPVVEPEAVSGELVAALTTGGKVVAVAIHANHPDEITGKAEAAIARLAGAGLLLLSQTVLLKGINDDASVLEALMRAFVRNRVKPYYLHHPDLAPGTGHFRLSIAEGRTIYEALVTRLSGLCRPAYVLDIPGGYGKVPVASAHVTRAGEGSYLLRDYAGGVHPYPPIRDE